MIKLLCGKINCGLGPYLCQFVLTGSNTSDIFVFWRNAFFVCHVAPLHLKCTDIFSTFTHTLTRGLLEKVWFEYETSGIKGIGL